MSSVKKSSQRVSSRSAPKSGIKNGPSGARNTATESDEELVQTSLVKSKTGTLRPKEPKSGFRDFLGSDAEDLLEAAAAETKAGFRPDRGTQQTKAKGSRTLDNTEAAASDNPVKGQPGRKKKTHFSVRAVAWIASGVDDCAGDKAPDYGACSKLAKQGLAVVAETEGDLQFPRDCAETEMHEWLSRDDMFSHIFAYYHQQLNPPTRNAGKKGKAVFRPKTPAIVQVKSSGQSRRLEPARDEPICGAAVEGRFPSGKSWDKRFLFFTGPIPIPDDIIETWSGNRELQTEGDHDDKDSDAEVAEDEDATPRIDTRMDSEGKDEGEGEDEGGGEGEDSDHSQLAGLSKKLSPRSTTKHATTSSAVSSCRNNRVVSGASAATSRSEATSVGTKRGRSASSEEEESTDSPPPPRKQRKRVKGNNVNPIVISDDDDYRTSGPSKPPSRPRPRTRLASSKVNISSSANDRLEASVKKLDRQISDLFIGAYIDSETIKRLAGSDSDD